MLLNVIVMVDATVTPTLEGENAWVMVGAVGVAEIDVGHALVPSDVGAVLVALVAPRVIVAVSVLPWESVTTRVSVPVPVATADELLAPETMVTPLPAVQA